VVTRPIDVLVVGGGPAGLATALALRQRGAEVMVADAMMPPIDKPCGEGLMPDSVRDLLLLGVDVGVGEGAEFHGVRFLGSTGRSLHGMDKETPGQVTARFPEGVGFGLRRAELHHRMVKRAQEVGVALRWQSQVRLEQDGVVMVNGKKACYGLLVGADGQSSQVRRWAGLDADRFAIRRFGFRRHFAVSSWTEYVEVHWGNSGQAYATPVAPGVVCIVSTTPDPRMRLADVLRDLPWLAEALRGRRAEMTPVDAERGCLMSTRHLQHVARARVALVGDASGSVDAITGEGLALGFRQAMLLAQCLATGTIEEGMRQYDRLHPRTLLVPQIMSRALLLMDTSAWLRERALRMMFRKPGIFARMLGLHLGAESLSHYLTTQSLPVLAGLFISGWKDAPRPLEPNRREGRIANA
jgi:menaquinone-9 beta-reductase